jgi:hypothetical protein
MVITKFRGHLSIVLERASVYLKQLVERLAATLGPWNAAGGNPLSEKTVNSRIASCWR